MLPAIFVLLDIRLFKVEVRDRFAEKRYLVIFDLTAIFQFLDIQLDTVFPKNNSNFKNMINKLENLLKFHKDFRSILYLPDNFFKLI